MSGFGSMPFGSGPYASLYSEPQVPLRAQLVASRKLDAFGRPVVLTDGTSGFEGMNNTMQRALILLALSEEETDRIGVDFATTKETEVRTALKPLVDEGVLEIRAIEAIDNGGASTFTRVELRDLVSGKIEVLKR